MKSKLVTQKRASPVLGVPIDTSPMEAKSAAALPEEDGPWQYEPKYDGFRCLAFKNDNAIELRAKSGKSLTRFFPEIVARLAALTPKQFVLDGELVIEIDGALSFDALQMRLHPAASRIAKLASETPARLVAFDMLLDSDGTNLLDTPLSERRKRLEAFFAGGVKGLVLSKATKRFATAQGWLDDSGGDTDGVVAKHLDGPYLPGERAMIKVKRLRSADCVVGGFRYESDSDAVGSLLLGLYDADGQLNHVGYTSTITDAERPALTKRLEKLRRAPGFTGRSPGGPSRWSNERSSEWQPLAPKLVVEVRFDHVTGNRFRHGTKLMRWRPDKAPKQCTFEQIPASGTSRRTRHAGER